MLSDSGIYTFYLCGIKCKYGILAKINFCDRVEDSCSCSFAFSVMFLHITYVAVFFYVKCVDSIMAAFIATAVVNSTACNNRYICSFFYIKIIINHIGHSCGIYNDWNMYFFAICLSININIDARLVLLLLWLQRYAEYSKLPNFSCNFRDL